MTIDYLDISIFGLYVAGSNGENDFPKVKRPYKHEWPDAHGIDIDLSTSVIEPRVITLDLIWVGDNAADFYSKMSLFQGHMQRPGLRVLKFNNIVKPFFVYLDDIVIIKRLTKYSATKSAALFSMRLVEPNPVGKFYYTPNPIVNVSFTMSCTSPITILWGDGTSQVVYGTNQAITKKYNPNILGTSGNCDSFTGWTQGTATLITDDGCDATLKCFEHAVGGSGNYSLYANTSSWKVDNQVYFTSGFAKITAGTLGRIQLQGVASNSVNATANNWTRVGLANKAYITTAEYALYVFASLNSTARFDNIMINKIAPAEYLLLSAAELLAKYAYNDGTTSSGGYTNYVGMVGDISKISKLTSLTGLTEITW